MGSALQTGVTGMIAHQKMLDITGNNLANMNTTAFKASRISFAELLGETIRDASQPTENTGGTNPMQAGGGVQVSSVDRNMNQGGISNTGRPLDMAIEGEGYFVVSDGEKQVYTRMGAFSVDANYYLVDPATGYRVQRTGTDGVTKGFQAGNDPNLRIPYDVALPAKATTQMTLAGNLSADDVDPTTHTLGSGMQYTVNGAAAGDTATLASLDQTSGLANGDSISITGTDRDGNAVSATFNITNPATQTLGDLTTAISTAFPDSTASIVNGEIRLKNSSTGYSLTDVGLSVTSAAGSMTVPSYFEVLEAGGQSIRDINIEVFDSQGISHTLSASFVKTDTANEWDLLLTNVSGDIDSISQRRIRRMSFLTDGSFGGILGSPADDPYFRVNLAGGLPTLSIEMDLGTVGEFSGLTQFGGSSTASPSNQDGYESGTLSSVSVTREGVVEGVFTNGVREQIGAMAVATFQNPSGLESIGNNYFATTGNSGDPIVGKANSGGAGAIRGTALEQSNVETASEFVNLIQAQNGFQANARTISVANEMLRELTNLIR